MNIYHNALGEIIKDSGSECEHLPSDDRVRQSETDKERLEDCKSNVGWHAKA